MTSTPANALASAAKFLPYLSAYSVASGLAYLWGYWSGFHIKILEHIELSSVLKLAIVPLAVTAGSAALGVLMGNSVVKLLPENKDARATLGKRSATISRLLTYGSVVVAGIALEFGTAWRWLMLAIAGGMLVFDVASAMPHIRSLAKSNRVASLAIPTLLGLPVHCFGIGAFQGEGIRDGFAFEYIAAGVPGIEATMSPLQLPRLVGRAGDHLFFFDPPTSAMLMMKLPTDRVLVIKHHVSAGRRPLLRRR